MKKLKELDFTPEEFEKCTNSPWYFYNKYAKKPEDKELTEEEYYAYIKYVKSHRNRSIRYKEFYEHFEYLPEFLKERK